MSIKYICTGGYPMYNKFDNLVKSSTTLEIVSLMLDDEINHKTIYKYMNISNKTFYTHIHRLRELCNTTIERLTLNTEYFNNRYNRMLEVAKT